MTLRDCYAQMGGNYDDAVSRYELDKDRHCHDHRLICMECNRAIALDACPVELAEKDIIRDMEVTHGKQS